MGGPTCSGIGQPCLDEGLRPQFCKRGPQAYTESRLIAVHCRLQGADPGTSDAGYRTPRFWASSNAAAGDLFLVAFRGGAFRRRRGSWLQRGWFRRDRNRCRGTGQRNGRRGSGRGRSAQAGLFHTIGQTRARRAHIGIARKRIGMLSHRFTATNANPESHK
jgi:hypothetical protein